MPTTKSAKKSMIQDRKRQARNYNKRVEVKDVIKKILTLTKDKKAVEAEKLLSEAFSIIDKAAKKNILHKNNASRKKSRLSAAIAKAK